MARTRDPDDGIDWSVTTWEGAHREALRRWAALPLERIVAALEEMEALGGMLAGSHVDARDSRTAGDDDSHDGGQDR